MIPGMAHAMALNAKSTADSAVRIYDDEVSKTAGVPMSRLLAALMWLPKPWTIFLALLLAAFVGWLDFVTGYELAVTAFYLVPIGWASWAIGRKSGLLLALASVGFAALADFASGHASGHTPIACWNAVMLLLVFGVAAYSISAATIAYRSLAEAQTSLQIANEGLEETVQQRTAALRSEIAERQRLEQAKLQAERLLERQEKLAVLGTLTAGIAHEIRNPLTSLKARLYTLEKHLHTLPAARKDTDIINAEISRLERIVQDALSFARPADPRLESIATDTLAPRSSGLDVHQPRGPGRATGSGS